MKLGRGGGERWGEEKGMRERDRQRQRGRDSEETDWQTDHYPTGCKGLTVPAGDRERPKETDRDHYHTGHKGLIVPAGDRETEIIILQGARVWLYLLETHRDSKRPDRQRSLSYRVQRSDCTCWRHTETQRDKTDRDHYHTGCKGLTVPAGDKRDPKRWNRQTDKQRDSKRSDRQTDRDHYPTGCKGLTVPAGDTQRLKETKQTQIIILQGAKVWHRDSKRWNRQTNRERLKEMRQTEIIILQGAKVWLYLLEQGRKNNDVTPATWPSPSVKYFFRASFSACLSSCTFVNSCQFHLSANKIGTVVRVGIAQWLDRWTPDWKIVGSSPCRSGGRIFFSSQLSALTPVSVSVPPPVLPQ